MTTAKSPDTQKHEPSGSSFTPGPWATWTRTPGVFALGSNLEIIHPDHMSRGRSEAEQMANARLIASAPELLEALKALLGELDEATPYLPDDFTGWSEIVHARAVIAKAEGRMSNREAFRLHLEAAYRDLFQNDPEYAYSAARITPEALATEMTDGVYAGSANKDGDGIKRACKACGIPQTYKAIRAFFDEVPRV